MPSGPRGRDALAADPSVRIDRIIGVPGISRAVACVSWRPVWLVGRAIASRWGWMQLGKSLGIPHAASWRSGVRQRWPAHHGPWRWRAGRAWQSVGSVRPSVRVLASIARVRAEGVGQESGERHEVRNDEKRVEHRPAASPPYLNHQRARDLLAWRVLRAVQDRHARAAFDGDRRVGYERRSKSCGAVVEGAEPRSQGVAAPSPGVKRRDARTRDHGRPSRRLTRRRRAQLDGDQVVPGGTTARERVSRRQRRATVQ